jgi:hypothetical protein
MFPFSGASLAARPERPVHNQCRAAPQALFAACHSLTLPVTGGLAVCGRASPNLLLDRNSFSKACILKILKKSFSDSSDAVD